MICVVVKYIVLVPFLAGVLSFLYSLYRFRLEKKKLKYLEDEIREGTNINEMMSEQNDWNEYKVHVLASINEMREDFKSFKNEMLQEISDLKKNMATLSMKTSFVAGFFGTLGGSIAVLITLLVTKL